LAESNSLLEALRTQKLNQLGILDTPPEPVFDDVTRIAAMIAGLPASVLTFVEGDRSFVKSSHNGGYLGNNRRQDSFCNITVQSPTEILVISDATTDSRVADNPHVLAKDVLCYAGCPILDSEGFALGALCVYDKEPHEFSENVLIALQALTRVVANIILQRGVH
jgi:GAF domain-containing protein